MNVILVMTMSFGALCPKCSLWQSGGWNRYLQVEKSLRFFVVFSRIPNSIRVGRGKKMTFFKKNKKKQNISPLVSDHVVTLTTFTVRAHFLDFPIDFFGGLPPSLYADEVLCAASRAALPPHILFGWRKNRKWRNSMQVGETPFLCNKYALPPHILFGWR